MTAFNVYNGDGSQTQFPITFDYFNVSEIEVLLWNSAVSKWQQKTNTVDYNIASTNINFVAAPAAPPSGITGNVLILRKTEVGTTTLTDAQAVYSPGSAINAADLNKNQIQALRAVLDLRDSNMPIHGKTWADSSQETRLYSDLNMTGREIKNVGKIKVETLAYTENGVEIEKDTKDAFTAFSELATKADLVAGKVPVSQIPDIAITRYLGAAANQNAMLALTGEEGDWCTRTDDGKVYIITGSNTTLISSWTALTYPAAPSTFVTSVAGRSGVVTLSTSDIAGLGTAAATNTTDYATAIQGSKADLAVQPPDLSNVAYSGSYNDLSSKPWATATGGINYANGNIGINATSPQAKLDVNSESTDGVYAIIRGTKNELGNSSHRRIKFFNPEFRMAIQAQQGTATVTNSDLLINPDGGNVGIGIEVPQSRLHIAEDGGTSIKLQDSTATAGVNSALITAVGTTELKIQASGGTTSKITSFYRSSNNESMRIDSSGNVGIGTSNPQYPLQVIGDIRLAGDNGGSDRRKWLLNESDDGSNSKLGIQTFAGGSWGDKLSIKSNGNVGIGTTNPQAKLDVNGAITSSGNVTGLTGAFGNITISGNHITGNTPKVAVYKAASGSTQNIDATTDTVLDISTASISDANFSNTSGAITISEAGIYEIHCSVGITGTTGNYRYTGALTCKLNGVGQAEVQGGYVRATSGSQDSYIDMTHVLSVSANDVVTFAVKRISTTSGDATTIDGVSRIIVKKL